MQETVLLNASVGVQRVIGRLRRPRSLGPSVATTLQTRSLAIARTAQAGIHGIASATHLAPARHGRRRTLNQAQRLDRVGLIGRIGPDRVVALAVALLVFAASVASVSTTGRPSRSPVGNTTAGDGGSRVAFQGPGGLHRASAYDDDVSEASLDDVLQVGSPVLAAAGIEPEIEVDGPFLDDGTLLKPIAVETKVEDGRDLIRTYKVKGGDTLTGIASKFDVSMKTLWWANDLDSKDELHLGQVLTIPPVNGLVVTVASSDTLDSLASKYKVEKKRVLAVNGLEDPNLVVGQVLIMPGAKGAPLPTPKPVKKPEAKPRSSSGGGGGGSAKPPAHYGGGAFLWPVLGGNNYISQYFHYGHYGLDIAADYGSRVRSAASGTVIFAGWKSNGGGYQVWVAHGSGLYTTYNHMSAVTVGRGQHVGRGQQVGRVGQSGWATGPHLHFEVWRGQVWNGGTRVNPLGYL